MLQNIKRYFRKKIESLLRFLGRYQFFRSILNVFYRTLPYRLKSWFHARFTKIFRGYPSSPFEKGEWKVTFAGKTVKVPMPGKEPWLEWDLALSILGHDVEILQTYEHLLRSDRKPAVFFDIGTNYGLHSILFLVHGVNTFSFEPNEKCHDFFNQFCESNQVSGNLQKLALGDSNCMLDFWFPENETWLGTAVSSVQKKLPKGALIKVSVVQTTLDEFVEKVECYPDLIKIDVEGNELGVLRGAHKTLSLVRPKVIFEVCGEGHQQLFDFFSNLKYRIASLPILFLNSPDFLDVNQFQSAKATNFIAIPD